MRLSSVFSRFAHENKLQDLVFSAIAVEEDDLLDLAAVTTAACSSRSGIGLLNLEIPSKSRGKTCEPPISVVTQKLEHISTEDIFPGDDIWRSPPSLTESRKTLSSSVIRHNISKTQVSSSSYLPPVKDPHPRWEIGFSRSSQPPPLNWRRAQILLRDARRTVCQRSINRRPPVSITRQ